MAYYSFINKLYTQKKITVFNKGKMLRDFTYIEDIVEGILKLLQKKIKPNHCVVNLGKGKPDKLFDLIKYIEKNTEKKFNINFTKSIPTGDIKKTYANVGKIKKLVNWHPKTKLEIGISTFVSWYKKYYAKN